MAVRSAVPTLADLVVTSGRGGGQTVVGGTQAGADLTLQDNSTATGGLIYIGSGMIVDHTGATVKVGILTLIPQNALDLPLDVRFRGGGSGQMTLVNDVLTVVPAGSSAAGGFFTRDTNQPTGFPAVLVPTTATDSLNVGPEAVNYEAMLVVNVPNGFPGNQSFTILKNDTGTNFGQILFSVGSNGGVGIGGIAPVAGGYVDCNLPIQLHGTVSGPPLRYGAQTNPGLAASPTGVLPVLQPDSSVLYVQLFAAAGGGAPTATHQDTFDRTAAALTTASDGGTWTLRGSPVPTWSTDGTHAFKPTQSGAGVQNVATRDTGSGDGRVRITFNALFTRQHLVFRYDPSNSSFFVLTNDAGTSYKCFYWNGSSYSVQVGATFTATPTAGDIVEAVLLGSSITLNVIRGGSTLESHGGTSSLNQALTHHGMGIENNVGYAGALFDDWQRFAS